jgi:hypothetical protein
MFPDRILPDEMEVAEGPPERPRSVSKVRRAAKLVPCRACGQLKNAGTCSCRHCGRILWRPIAFLFLVALVLKAGAISCSLFAADLWVSNLAFWGGSFLGGFSFLLAVFLAIEAYSTRRARNRLTPAPAADLADAGSVAKPVALGVGEATLLLASGVGFVLVGIQIDLVLLSCLAGGAFLIGFVMVGVGHYVVVSRASRALPTRIVAQPQAWPALPEDTEGIICSDEKVTSKNQLAKATAGHVVPGQEVKLRVRCGPTKRGSPNSAAITLDGQVIGIGSARRGFDARTETTPGAHELRIQWAYLTQRFDLNLPTPGAYQADLSYDTFWGKFQPEFD